MRQTDAGVATMVLDRGHGLFGVELGTASNWWPRLVMMVGKGSRRIETSYRIPDGGCARRFPSSCADREYVPGAGDQIYRDSLAIELPARLYDVAAGILDLKEAIYNVLNGAADELLLVRHDVPRKNAGTDSLLAPAGAPPDWARGHKLQSIARMAQQTGLIPVVAFHIVGRCHDGQEVGKISHALVTRTDMQAMKLFLESLVLFREFEKRGTKK